jgi:hypothetical protein
MTKMLKTISVVVSIVVGGYSSCALATDYAALTAGLTEAASGQWGSPGNMKMAFVSAAEPTAPIWAVVSPNSQSDAWLKAYVDTLAPPGPATLDWLKADSVPSGVGPYSALLAANPQADWTTGLMALQSGSAVNMASEAAADPIDYARLLRPLDPGAAADFELYVRDGSDRI